jgi:hypothetical protein
MEEKVIKLKITDNSDEAQKNAQDLKKDFDKVNASVEKLDKSLQNVEKDVSDISNATKSASSGLQRMGQGISKISANVKTIGLGLLVSQFDDFKEAISSSNDITDLYSNTLNTTKKAASDFGKVLFGCNLLGTLKDALGSVLDGSAIGKTKEYFQESFKAAQNGTELTNKAAMAAVKQAGIFEKFDRQAEIERKTRDNQLLSFNERIKASDNLKVILSEQTKSMLAQAAIQQQAKQAAFDLTGKREDEIALEESKNNVLAIRAQIQGLITEQDQGRISLLLETRQVQSDVASNEIDLLYAKEEVANTMFINDKDRLMAERETLKAQLADYVGYYAQQEKLAKKGSAKRAEIELAASQKLGEIQNKLSLNAYQNALEDIRILEVRKESQLSYVATVGSAIGALGGLFAQGTAAAKAAALSEIAINTAVGFVQGLDIAQKGAKAGGPAAPFLMPIFYASQVAAVLGAASRAKSVLESGNISGGDSGGGVSSIPQPQAPRFNVVGASGINQVAQVVGQSQQPIKAYVVSSEVSSQQSLDRNKVMSASLG